MDSEATALMAISSDRPSSRRATLNFEILSMLVDNAGGVERTSRIGRFESVRTRKYGRERGEENGEERSKVGRWRNKLAHGSYRRKRRSVRHCSLRRARICMIDCELDATRAKRGRRMLRRRRSWLRAAIGPARCRTMVECAA